MHYEYSAERKGSVTTTSDISEEKLQDVLLTIFSGIPYSPELTDNKYYVDIISDGEATEDGEQRLLWKVSFRIESKVIRSDKQIKDNILKELDNHIFPTLSLAIGQSTYSSAHYILNAQFGEVESSLDGL